MVENGRANGKLGVDEGVEVNALNILTDKGQASVAAEIVGEFLNSEIGHEMGHLQGYKYMIVKRLI